MKRIFLIMLVLAPFLTRPQTISTLAGNGVMGCCLDSGLAATAELYNPTSVAVDKNGNLYIADFGNSRIRKVSTSGIITTVAGSLLPGYSGDGGQATTAQLNTPWGVAVDTSGNIFISDYGNNVIRKVNTAGIITTFAGNGSIGYSGDGSPATNAEFHKPRGIAADHFGNIFIADPQNNVVRKVNPSGIISTVAGNGTAGYSGDSIAATAAELNAPFGVAADNSGNLFIADWDNYRIRKVNASGIITTVAGIGTAGYIGDGLAATVAQIIPAGVNVDDSGNIYFPDDLNSVIRKVNAAGIITTIAGNGTPGYSGDGGPATAAMLHTPFGVAGNCYTNLYIADELNNRIRKVTWLFGASFTASADTVCQDSCITFINYSTGSIDSVRWSVPGYSLANPHGDTITFCFLAAGFDTVKLYVYDTGRVDSFMQVVSIKPMPHPMNHYYAPNECCYVIDSYLSYQWYESEGPTIIPGATSSNFGAGMGGWYVVVDSGGCLGISNVLWVAEGVANINSPNNNIHMYPNPVNTTLTVSARKNINQIIITNIIGQTVFTNNYNSNQVQINVATLPSGVYFIKINGTVVRKFLKE